MRRIRLIGFLVVVMVLATVSLTAAQGTTPSVTVNDQAIQGGTVTVDKVVAAQAGWMVIHAEADGKPGPVVGHSAVAAGENTNVVVEIDTAKATAKLFAMLHVDAGEMGKYEFPGPDGPVKVDGKVVVVPFAVTGLPAMLPQTGGVSTAWLGLAAAGLLLLLAGLATRRVMA
jgi:LPXTG-motif cell wall-anchored protein